jgi:5'-nucleotidase
MRILLTNDDGIRAPGLEALYRAVADLGEVEVVAPDQPQSATAHGISVLTPLMVRRFGTPGGFSGWSVAGRPADCVKLAMVELLGELPDLVLSGINAGANPGVNVLYSGTVAGAVEAALFRVPAIAFSLELSSIMDFDRAGRIARRIVEHVLAASPAPGICLNVNIPVLRDGIPRGIRCCSQAPVGWEERYDRSDGPDHRIYTLNGRLPERYDHPDSDLAAMRAGYVSITPLRPDLTDHARLPHIAGWTWPERFD